jgi:tetratricopeptide (TPR) repeat protein
MSREDWYRKKTWTIQDREDFLARLKRSRGTCNKAQYARIQAIELLATKNPLLIQPALDLLDLILSDWPQESSQLASTYAHRAECFLRLGRLDEAIAEFRKTFEQQRKNPGWITNAHIDFAWLVSTRRLQNYYTEALDRLGEFGDKSGIFPIIEYKTNAARALIAHQQGQLQQAKNWAKDALQAAGITQTKMRYHPTVGLVVQVPDERVQQQLLELANIG